MLKNVRRGVGMLACISIYIKISICRECFKYITERQKSSMGLVKGLLSWHNVVAVLAKVLL